jgi:hypothetical protein
VPREPPAQILTQGKGHYKERWARERFWHLDPAGKFLDGPEDKILLGTSTRNTVRRVQRIYSLSLQGLPMTQLDRALVLLHRTGWHGSCSPGQNKIK